MIIRIMILTLMLCICAWQVWELSRYGDDSRINVFSTGDFHRLTGL